MKFSFQDYISIKIHKTDLNLTNFVKAKLEPYNLAPEQNLIMMLLWEKDGLSQHQLVETLNKDKTNIARMASNLEKKGFITRTNCLHDRRSVRLYLTEKGQELGEKVVPIAEDFNEIVCKGISEEELLQMERLLAKINQNVQKLL
ncbi:DNA-binding transcriptional regulator, MarR family [Mesobacillus persicus]|uniref:DNA-binding transcriptional regulator, MarR family n=1 Tax=Mesobacillus persicus TaxID=930146 RepID=A0A1H8I8A5_9BACI|nr:MarR family transcriptional regulator [Mesobacillus persicus]SEN64609.1 DNA-binding transcriptional regulator, MarR family [Mesobacillus persicus]